MADKKLKKLSKKSAGKSKGLKDQAGQIWLAGLGAFNRAQEEGNKIFEALVKEGRELESRSRKVTSAKVNEVRGAVEGTVGQVQARASKSWDKLEHVFEARVARALGVLGVPTSQDIKQLTDRVAELQKAVNEFKGQNSDAPARAKKPAAKKAVAKKAVAKKAVAKKATVKKTASKKAPVRKAAAKKTLKKKTLKK
jgi:poly(hydroxyalkanoate) granule-associated protein